MGGRLRLATAQGSDLAAMPNISFVEEPIPYASGHMTHRFALAFIRRIHWYDVLVVETRSLVPAKEAVIRAPRGSHRVLL
jgi:hypothetical protein